MRTDWMIGICNTSSEGVVMYRFRGTKEDVKQKLFELIQQDKENDEELWDYGTDFVEDIEDDEYEMYGYGCYHDYHIDYTAIEWSHVEFI